VRDGFEILTPEHVALRFRLAEVGVRVGAVLLDYLFITVPLIAGVFVVALLSLGGGEALWFSILVLAAFLLRNFYFPGFELRWQGRTPGKRILKLRVIARDGGPLTPGMIFARNLTRELEIFIPLVALFAPTVVADKVPAWLVPVSLLWVVVIVLLPLIHRHHARLGDLLAGTLVVHEPRVALLPDLANIALAPQATHPGAAADPRQPTFTEEQLSMYGIHELQVLEDVLRRDFNDDTILLMAQITDRIQQKIAWEPPAGAERMPPVVFLKAFYTAQRAHLEHRMLLGQRRESKKRGRLSGSGQTPRGERRNHPRV
jgi:uncharacterized RDD family membrane protein YckC